MVEYAKENEQEIKQGISDVVCPKCFKPLLSHCMLRSWQDRYEQRLRQYMSWCLDCQTGSEVIQFLAGEKWVIHKYRCYAFVAQTGKNAPSGQWQIVNELPKPPAVVMGTGGDYCKGYEPKTVDLMKTLLSALKSTVKTVENLLNMAAETKDE